MIQRCNPVKVLLSLRVQRRRTRNKNPKPEKQAKQTTPIPSFLPSFLSLPPRTPSLAPDPQCNSRRLVPSLLLVYKQKTQPPRWYPSNGLHDSRVFAAAAAATAAAGCR